MSISRDNKKQRQRITEVLKRLAGHYPRAATGLVYENHYQLLVATVLSAQTTDEQVNRITADLFKKVPSINDLARMNPAELEPLLKRCGLFRNKSRFLVEAAKMIVNDFKGEIPQTMEELTRLPGVGRKTANILLSSAFGIPAMAVDTHVFRVSRRLNLADGNNANAVEWQLREAVPREEWSATHHRLIAHGRSICSARNPGCGGCFLIDLCVYVKERGIA